MSQQNPYPDLWWDVLGKDGKSARGGPRPEAIDADAASVLWDPMYPESAPHQVVRVRLLVEGVSATGSWTVEPDPDDGWWVEDGHGNQIKYYERRDHAERVVSVLNQIDKEIEQCPSQ